MSSWQKHAPDYHTRGPGVIVTAVVLITVTTIALTIRLWARLVATRARLWWDDAMLIATTIFSHAYLATMIWWVHVGFGKHQWMIPAKDLKKNILALHLIITWYITAILFAKLSALTLYGRLFRVSKRTRYVLWAVGAVSTGWSIAYMILPWMNCTPVAKTLDPMIPGKCEQRRAYYYAVAIVNAVLDFIILLLPMPIVWRLTMSTQKKIFTTIVFLLGYSSAILSLTRFVMIVVRPGILFTGANSDPTWDDVPLNIASMLEAPVAILALCGPPMNQIVRRAKTFGWGSLFSTAQYPTPIPISESPRSGSSFNEKSAADRKASSVFSRVVKKKASTSSRDLGLVPPLPSHGQSIPTVVSNGPGEHKEVWEDNVQVPSGRIQVNRDFDVI